MLDARPFIRKPMSPTTAGTIAVSRMIQSSITGIRTAAVGTAVRLRKIKPTPITASEVQSFQDRRAPRRLAMTAVTPTLPATID